MTSKGDIVPHHFFFIHANPHADILSDFPFL